MVLTDEQKAEFNEAKAPILAFMQKHLDPQASVIITQDAAGLFEEVGEIAEVDSDGQ